MKDGKFEPFEQVLVRDADDRVWYAGLFSHYSMNADGKQIYCVDGFCFTQCIPYEGHKSLVGTTDNPKEPEHFEFGDHVEVKNYENNQWIKAIFHSKSYNECPYPYYAMVRDFQTLLVFKYCRKADW